MRIGGLTKLTLLDYPGLVAATVFFTGCELRCPFCHNRPLVLPRGEPTLEPRAVLDFLERRRGRLDGVCLSGGEPTLQPGLPDLIREIRALGFSVKLDTNGSRPQVLRDLLDQGLLDYVAMDIKNAPDRYLETCGGVDILPQARESAALLLEGSVPYEFRTTVCRPFHDPQAMARIGQWLRGADRYFLQPFADSGDLVGSGVEPMEPEGLAALLAAVRPYIPTAAIRGA